MERSMRQIKFRAWDSVNKKMWNSNNIVVGDGVFLYGGNNLETLVHTYTLKHDFIAQQFTGLLDKNGKEIYEGDVIKVWDLERGGCEQVGEHDIETCEECSDENYLCTQEIKFNCGWFCSEDKGDYCPPLNEDYLELKIIGNIYENPELVK